MTLYRCLLRDPLSPSIERFCVDTPIMLIIKTFLSRQIAVLIWKPAEEVYNICFIWSSWSVLSKAVSSLRSLLLFYFCYILSKFDDGWGSEYIPRSSRYRDYCSPFRDRLLCRIICKSERSFFLILRDLFSLHSNL